MSGVNWNTLVVQNEGEKVENFLLDADVASVIFEIDPGLIKQSLFGAMAKFEKFAAVQVRCFQLLQDCHLLSPPGISNEEILPRYDAILRALSSWIGKAEVVLNIFQLLSMIADREVMRQKGIKVEEHELIYYVNKAIALHSNAKPVQRAALQLFEAIIENSNKSSFIAISGRIFKPVLDNLLLNGDDTSICFSSFSILNGLAGHSAALIAPWTDQIINLSLTTIGKQLSGEVSSQCLQLLSQITKDKDSLVTVAGHERGLKVFLDALHSLRPKHLFAMQIDLQLLLSVIEDYDIATVAFQSIGEEDPLEYAIKLREELREKFDKFVRLCTEEDNLDEKAMETLFLLHSQVDVTLEEMIKDVPEEAEGEGEEIELSQEQPNIDKEAIDKHVDQRIPFSAAVKEEVPSAALLAEVEGEEGVEEDAKKAKQLDDDFAVRVEDVHFTSSLAPNLTPAVVSLPGDYLDAVAAVDSASTMDQDSEVPRSNISQPLEQNITNESCTVIDISTAKLVKGNLESNDANYIWGSNEQVASVADSNGIKGRDQGIHEQHSHAFLLQEDFNPNADNDDEEEDDFHLALPVLKSSSNAAVDQTKSENARIAKSMIEPALEPISVSSKSPLIDSNNQNSQLPSSFDNSNGTAPNNLTGSKNETTSAFSPKPDIKELRDTKSTKHSKSPRNSDLEAARATRAREIQINGQKKTLQEQTKLIEQQKIELSTKDNELLRLKTERKKHDEALKASEGRVAAAAMKIEQLKMSLNIANDQASKSLQKAETLHQMFRDATNKIEILVRENEKVWNKFYELQNADNQDDGASIGSHQAEQAEMEIDMSIAMSSHNSLQLLDTPTIEATESQSDHVDRVTPLGASSALRRKSDTVDEGSEKDDFSRPTSSILTPVALNAKKPNGFKLSSLPSSSSKNVLRSANDFMQSSEGKLLQQSSRNVVEDSKLSIATAGIMEALDHLDSSTMPMELTHSLYPDIQSTAERVLMLFNKLVQATRRPISSHSAGNPLIGNSLSIRSLKACLEAMGLLQGLSDSSVHSNADSRRRTDLLLSQFRAKHITLFGSAFTIVLCANEKNIISCQGLRSPTTPNSTSDHHLMSMKEILHKVQWAIDRYLMNIQKQTSTEDLSNPLDAEPLLFSNEFDEIAKLLETQKKPLSALFTAYTPWIDNNSSSRASASSNLEAIVNSPDSRSLRRVHLIPIFAEKFGNMVGGITNRMRYQDASCFAKDFTICPGLFSNSQLAEIFNSVDRPKSAVGLMSIDQDFNEITLTFTQFVDFIYLCAVRCPLFRGSAGPAVGRLVNFFHLLNQSPGKDIVAKRSRSTEMVIFRPPERAAVNPTANFVRNGHSPSTSLPLATAILVPSPGKSSYSPYPLDSRPNDQRRRKKSIEELRTYIVGSK